MRRGFGIYLIVLLLGLLTMAPAAGYTQTNQIWYQHPEGAYKMKVPPGWSILKPNTERDVDIIAVSESSEELLICDRHSTNLSGLTPEQSLTTFELSLKQTTARQQLSRTTIGGMPAVLASNYDTVKKTASYTLIVLYQQRSYQLGASIPSPEMLPAPPQIIRDCWASVVWMQKGSVDGNPKQPSSDGSVSDVDVSVPQQYTPSASDQADGNMWVEPALVDSPLSMPAFSVDTNSLAWSPNNIIPGYRAQLSAACEAMRLLYGPMNSQQALQFEAKWAPYYHQTTPEVDVYMRTAAPYLGRMVVARSGFAQAVRGFYRLLVQVNIARVSGDTRSETELLRLCRYAQTLMIGYQACIEGLHRQMVLLGDPPNPLLSQPVQNERYQSEVNTLYKLAGVPVVTDGDRRQQMTIADELHSEYLNNLSRCFKEARQDITSKAVHGYESAPEILRRLFWVDTLQRMADDDLSLTETKQPTHRRSLLDDLNAQLLINGGREEAQKVQRMLQLLQTASMLQQQLPAGQLVDADSEWTKRVNARLLVNRSVEPLEAWIRELTSKSMTYWSGSPDDSNATEKLARSQTLLQAVESAQSGIAMGLSDVPISGLGSDGALCWGPDGTSLAAFEGAQGYQPGGVVKLSRVVLEWSQSLCQAARLALEGWSIAPGSDQKLTTASDIVALSKCFDVSRLYTHSSGSKEHGTEPDYLRFQADLQQGKKLAEAYILAEQRLKEVMLLDPASKELLTLRLTALQLAASVFPSTSAKAYLRQLSAESVEALNQRREEMNKTLQLQMMQILVKQGYQASALHLKPVTSGMGSIDWMVDGGVSTYQRGTDVVSLYQLLQDARAAYYQAYENVSRYDGLHGCSAKSDSQDVSFLPFADALSQNIVKLSPAGSASLPVQPLDKSELSIPVEPANFKITLSSDTGITNTQEQCRQLNRDIRLKLIPWLESQTAKTPVLERTASYFRKLQMVLERASRKQPNPGLLYLATQELERITGGVGIEQMVVSLSPILDVLSQ